jgi:hypothetical protein
MARTSTCIVLLVTLLLPACGGSNAPPVISAPPLSTNEDTVGFVDVSASDPDGDAITLTVSGAPVKGQATVSSGSPYRLTYTPNADANGADTVGLQVTDSHGVVANVQVAVTIVPVADPVRMAAQAYSTDEDAQLTGRIVSSDPDGGAVSISIVVPPAHGTLQVTNPATGDFRYTPAADYNGQDSFTASSSDGESTATAAMTLTVQPVNDAPVAVDDALVIAVSGPGLLDVLANDRDVDGDPLSLAIVDPPAGAAATVVGNRIQVTPTAGAAGPTRLTYRIADSSGVTSTATARLVIGSAMPVFYTSGDAADAVRIYRFDMFTNQLLSTPVPTGETLSGFTTSANGRRMLYTTRAAGPPARTRLWLRNLVDLSVPVQEIPMGSSNQGALLISPDAVHAIVGTEHINLDNPAQRQVFDSSAEQVLLTRDGGSMFYTRLLGGGSRAVYRITLSGGGFGGPFQMTSTPGAAQGLGLQLALSPDETLIASQGLYIDAPLGLQAHAYVTHANGSQDDRRVSPAYTLSVDHAPRPGVTFDSRFAYYSGTVAGTSGVYAADLTLPGAAQAVATIPGGYFLVDALVASDSRTFFYGAAPVNTGTALAWYKGSLDQAGSAVAYSPAGMPAPATMSISPDGTSVVMRSGTNWYLSRAPDFATGIALHAGANASGLLSFAPDSHAVTLIGTDSQPGVRVMNPRIPEWFVQLPLGAFGNCVAWAGQRCAN